MVRPPATRAVHLVSTFFKMTLDEGLLLLKSTDKDPAMVADEQQSEAIRDLQAKINIHVNIHESE